MRRKQLTTSITDYLLNRQTVRNADGDVVSRIRNATSVSIKSNLRQLNIKLNPGIPSEAYLEEYWGRLVLHCLKDFENNYIIGNVEKVRS
jgi:hypothetical protein